MDQCAAKIKEEENCSNDSLKTSEEEKIKQLDLKSTNNDESKNLEDRNAEELNDEPVNKNLKEVENQLNNLNLNDKRTQSKQRIDDDASEDEYFDITSDNSNADSEELSSLPENKPKLNNVDNLDDEELNLKKLNKSENDERELGDGEVSRFFFYFKLNLIY